MTVDEILKSLRLEMEEIHGENPRVEIKLMYGDSELSRIKIPGIQCASL